MANSWQEDNLQSEREYVLCGQLYSDSAVEIVRIVQSDGQTSIDHRAFTSDYVKAIITADNRIVPVVDMKDMVIGNNRAGIDGSNN